MGPRTGQEALKEQQLLTLTGIQPRFLGVSAHMERGKVVFPYHLQNQFLETHHSVLSSWLN